MSEVDSSGKRGAGDSDGRGSATVIVVGDNTVCTAELPDGALRGQLNCTTLGERCVLPAET